MARLEAQLKDWETSLGELKAKAGDKLHLEDWSAKKTAALSKLEQLRADGGERWDVLKMGVDSAWDELRAAFETVTSKTAQPGPASKPRPNESTPDRKAS